MFQYKIKDISKHVTRDTFNIIEIPENINISYGKIKVITSCCETDCYLVVKNGVLKFSENILNKLFQKYIDFEISVVINIEDLLPFDMVPIAEEIVISSTWNPNLPDDFDLSNSIYSFFNQTEHLLVSINDYLSIPINFADSTKLLQSSISVIHNLSDYLTVKVVSMLPEKDNCGLRFQYQTSKMIYNSKCVIYDKIFHLDDDFNRFSSELIQCFEKIKPILSQNYHYISNNLTDSSAIYSVLKHRLIHICGSPRSGKGYLVRQICQIIGYRCIVVKLCDIYCGQSVSASEKKFDRLVSMFKSESDYFAIHFEDFDKFFANMDSVSNGTKFDNRSVRIFIKVLNNICTYQRQNVLLFISTIDDVPVEIDQYVVMRHSIGFLSSDDRLALIKEFLDINSENINEIVRLSNKITVVDLISMLKSITPAHLTSDKSIVGIFKSSASSGSDEARLDLDAITWKDIGGQQHVIDKILSIVNLTTSNHKPVSGFTVRKSGILLYGEPGTGKTLIAKAVANECFLNFISVKGPELLNMYVGQTEENVRSLFIKVRQMVPCLLFCDELDSLIPRRGFSGDSGGVMDRVVSQFAVELDSIHNEENMRVMIMGATNRPDLIDPALLRNGRFDKIFHITGGLDKTSQLEILKSQTYKLNLAVDVDLENVVNQLSERDRTGAEIYGFVSQAVMNALRRTIKRIEDKQIDIHSDFIVNMSDFVQAIN